MVRVGNEILSLLGKFKAGFVLVSFPRFLGTNTSTTDLGWVFRLLDIY